MDEIMRIIFQYAPMNGACNKIMKNSIHEFENLKSHFIIEYYQGLIDKEDLDKILNMSFTEFSKENK